MKLAQFSFGVHQADSGLRPPRDPSSTSFEFESSLRGNYKGMASHAMPRRVLYRLIPVSRVKNTSARARMALAT